MKAIHYKNNTSIAQKKHTQSKNLCYNKDLLGRASKVSICTLGIMMGTAVLCPASPFTSATEANETFTVNVKEFLSVSVTTPTTWASGDVNTLLRNKVTVAVASNNSSDFVVGLNSGNSTATLANTSVSEATLPTLASDWTRASSTTNFWGYSTNDDSATGTYKQVPTSSSTPAQLFNSSDGSSKDIYFGAKADTSLASGTYAGTVVFTAITGSSTIATPTNPATPATQDQVAEYHPAPSGGSSNGTTSYTYRRTNTTAGTTTTTTQVSDGDNTSAYSNYTPPQGVTASNPATTMATTSNVSGTSPMAVALAATASVAAVTGTGFFILAKRKKDDDDEEEQTPGM